MPRLRTALALRLRLAFASALTPGRGGITRRRPVGISRILPQLLGELRELLTQLGDALLELRYPRVLGGIACFAGSQRCLELGNSLIPPVLRHGPWHCPATPGWKAKKTYGAIWTTYETGERLPYEGRVDLGNNQPGDGRRFKG